LTSALEGGEGVSVTPQPHLTPGKEPVPIVQEALWASGPVWTGAENLAPTRIHSPDLPAHRQSLYRLSYPAHLVKLPNSTTIQYYTMIEHTRFLHLICLFAYSLSPAYFGIKWPLSGKPMKYSVILPKFYINHTHTHTHTHINLYTLDVYSLNTYFDFGLKRSLQ